MLSVKWVCILIVPLFGTRPSLGVSDENDGVVVSSEPRENRGTADSAVKDRGSRGFDRICRIAKWIVMKKP